MTTRGLVTVAPDDSLDLAAQIMLWAEITHLPVVARGEVLGVLAARDLIARREGVGVVGAAMTAPAVTIGPDDDLATAATTMAARRIGCLPVVEDGALVGILTIRDVLGHQVSRMLRPHLEPGPPVSRLMRKTVFTVKPTDDLVDAVARMSVAGVRHLPVVDGEGLVVGMLSDRDVRAAVGSPALALDRAAAYARVRALKVRDVMTRDPICVGPDVSAAEITSRLVDHRIGALPVVDQAGRLLGIVSYVDILRAVTEA